MEKGESPYVTDAVSESVIRKLMFGPKAATVLFVWEGRNNTQDLSISQIGRLAFFSLYNRLSGLICLFLMHK